MVDYKKSNGYSIFELVLVVLVTSILALIAIGSYIWFIPKAQVSEAKGMINNQVLSLTTPDGMKYCSSGEESKKFEGKYGVLTVSSGSTISKGGTCPSGCVLSYKFNTNAHSLLGGSILAVDLLNNGKLSNSSLTTLTNRLIPSDLATITPSTGDSCAAQTITDPAKTDGTDGGDETGIIDPDAPVTPPGGTDPDPVNPDGSGTPEPEPPAPPAPPTVEELQAKCNAFYSGTMMQKLLALRPMVGGTFNTILTNEFIGVHSSFLQKKSVRTTDEVLQAFIATTRYRFSFIANAQLNGNTLALPNAANTALTENYYPICIVHRMTMDSRSNIPSIVYADHLLMSDGSVLFVGW